MTSPLETTPLHTPTSTDTPWWWDAVIYQVYPRSWADADGDGIGDLPGALERLPYLRHLGVDALWFSPFYRSPQHDAGYDVADYRDVDPLFGDVDDIETVLDRAAELDLKVIVDLVPNHTSADHAWFQAALTARPGSPERERYIFRDGKGDGSEPPNDWRSVFGGEAWTRVVEPDGSEGQWYLHLFDTTQPDLNWDNPVVREEFLDILRFWLDRGVQGFRVDVAHGLVKQDGLPDYATRERMLSEHQNSTDSPYWDQDEVHEIYRTWREVLDSYEGDRMMVAEAWVKPLERAALYVRPDEFNQSFNFDFLESHWVADELREVIAESLRANDLVGAPTTWVLSNHDVVRHASRFGLEQTGDRPNGIAADDPQPDPELGLRRARAGTALMLALPGSSYVYQGEELGLPEHTTMPHEHREDPTFHRTGGEETGRDGCRVPMPWAKDEPAFGFNETGASWLPQPEVYGDLAVDQQLGAEGSTLELYRGLIAERRARGLGRGALAQVEGLGEDVVGYVVTGEDGRRTLVVTNLGDEPVELPEGAEVVISSAPLDADRVPTDVTVWASLP